MTKLARFLSPFVTRSVLAATLPGLAQETSSSSSYQPFYLSNGNLIPWGTTSNPVVTQQGLLGLPAAWSCVNMISHAVATMLVSANVLDATGTEVFPTPQIATLPNPFYSSPYEYWHEVCATLLIYGNYFAVIYDGTLIPVHPVNVDCRISNEGRPVYKIGETLLSQDEVLHVRGLTMPGSWNGLGVIEAQRKALATSVDMQNYQNTTFSSGGVPSAVISLDAKNVPTETLIQVGEDWQAAFGSGNRKPVVLSQGMTVAPIAWSPLDAQFLESRQFDIAEIALMFGLNPTDLTATIGGSNLTYANVSDANQERVKRSYAPWTMRIESAWSRLLPQGNRLIANPEAILRMGTAERYASYTTALGAGFMTIDEVRALEHLPPMNGDTAP